jgi:pyridoxal 5'-phosphate synthase pdxS subunit
VKKVQKAGRLPVVTFVAGGIATPADAALMMMLGSEGCFVGSGIFKSSNPAVTAKAIVQAVINWQDPARLAELSEGLGEAMRGLEMKGLETKLAERGW